MTGPATNLSARLAAYHELLDVRMRDLLTARTPFEHLYGMMAYHLGWRDQQFRPCHGADRGQRLRPTVCFLACEALNGSGKPALPAATAVELAHNFTLVHDDIEDRSPLRRHRRTVWSVWGTANGINVGDGLFSLAQLALVDDDVPAELGFDGARILNRACLALCEGQTLDLQLAGATQVTLDRYLRMIEAKTGALFGCAAELGARFGGGSAELAAGLRRIGMALGVTYQMVDDLVGIWGDDSTSGKTADDISQRKRGLPVVLAWERATGADRMRLHGLYTGSRPLTGPEAQWVLRMLGELDVQAAARRRVEARLRQVETLIRRRLPAGEARAELLALVARLADRTG